MSEIRLGHLEVDSPFGNAGGVVKSVEDVEVMARTGVGWIEAGSYTLEPLPGNALNPETGQYDRTVYHHDPESGETYNSLGMPNKGFDAVEKEIPDMAAIAHGYGKPLVVNVAPVSADPAAEAKELVARAYEAGADTVLLNGGCPNVITADGGRHEILSRDPLALYKTLEALRPVVAKYQKVFVRVSPQDTARHTILAVQAIKAAGTASVISTPNTWPGHKPVDNNGVPLLGVPGNIGGKSGPATAEDAYTQTVWFASKSLLDVISSGGITHGKELHRRLAWRRNGNVVAGAGTTFFYESGDWRHDVDKLIWEYQDSVENS